MNAHGDGDQSKHIFDINNGLFWGLIISFSETTFNYGNTAGRVTMQTVLYKIYQRHAWLLLIVFSILAVHTLVSILVYVVTLIGGFKSIAEHKQCEMLQN